MEQQGSEQQRKHDHERVERDRHGVEWREMEQGVQVRDERGPCPRFDYVEDEPDGQDRVGQSRVSNGSTVVRDLHAGTR